MNKPVCTPPQLNFWIICALFMIVAVSPQLDLAVSAFFFRDNRFYLGDWGFFPFLRRGLPEIFIGIAAAFEAREARTRGCSPLVTPERWAPTQNAGDSCIRTKIS